MYRVEWHQAALDELTTVCTNANSVERRAITASSHAIDKGLQGDPEHVGESRPGGRRVEFFPPLAVTFQIEADG